MSWIAYVFALLAGGIITVQAGSNSQLKQSLNSPLGALVVNYALGLAAITACALFARVRLPSLESIAGVPWWAWAGGILGIVYGLAVVFLAQRMGAATLIATVVTGQLICSVVVDHFALVGFQPHRASPLRITGCALMIAGLTLIAKL